MDALHKAINLFGSQAKLSRAVGGDSTQLVHNWLKRGRVPPEWCPNIEEATGGKVRCEELRPDVKWYVLRQSYRRRSSTIDQESTTGNT